MIDRFLRFGVDFFDLIRSGTFSYGELAKLKEIQYYDKTKHEKIIDYRIKEIVNHAYHNVLFYRKLYDSEKIATNNIMNSGDLAKLPIVTKAMLRRNFPDAVISKNDIRRATYDRTSGSTGEPFEFYNDSKSAPIRKSAYTLFNTWMGVGPHEKHVQIASPKPKTIHSIIRNRIFRKYKISTLKIKRRSIRQVVSRINEIDPKYLEGYSASLGNTAHLIDELDIELTSKPKAAIATSEDLIEPHRRRIEDVFDTTVFNRYGSREFSGAVAQECDLFEGSHVNTALCYVEIVDEEGEPVGEGERGKIVITDFHNHVMPFIRYDIGDSAIKGPEKGECGRTFPIIKDIIGKPEFFLISEKDVKTPIETIQSYLFQKFAPNVYKFQFIHNSKGSLVLKIVPTNNFEESMLKEMYNYLESTLHDFKIKIEIVEEIPPLKSGKTPFFIVGYPH